MSSKHFPKGVLQVLAIVSFIAALALVALGALLIGLPSVVGAQGPDDGISAQAVVDTTFTYQGRLVRSSSVVNDTCNFRFTLYDDADSGSQVGNPQTVNSVAVSDGNFAVELNGSNEFGDNAFTGDARYLEVEVQCSGDSSFVPLNTGTPKRVALNPAPYAHSLRPGAVINGSGVALTVRTSNNSGQALSGEATATTGNASGVYGGTKAPNGAGVAGFHTGSDGYGVYGIAGSGTGVGVYGEATSQAATDDTAYGGKFVSNGRGDIGVYGESKWSGGPISGYGVYGKANSTYGYGVYSEGNAHVAGNLTWQAKTSYVSVSAAAFDPQTSTMSYSNHGSRLIDGGNSSPNYRAPVQLPHGATVTGMTFYWNDTLSAHNGRCQLLMTTLNGYVNLMAEVESTGSSGTGSNPTNTIDFPTIDNSQRAYYLDWHLPCDGSSCVVGYGVTIEYTFTGPY